MNKLSIIRTFFGLLALSSIIIEIIALLLDSSFKPANFFSFFTVLSNIAAATVFLYFGLQPKANSSRRAQLLRSAAALYMLMTGVIFAVLLADIPNVQLTAVPWNNIVLHYIMPTVVILDWVFLPPKGIFVRLRTAALALVFPLAYVAYSLIRGAIVGWYPYPFLNPQASSYSTVFMTIAVLSLGVIAVTLFMRFYINRNATR